MTEQELCDEYIKSFAAVIDENENINRILNKLGMRLWSRKLNQVEAKLTELANEFIHLDRELKQKIVLPESHSAKTRANAAFALVFSIRDVAYKSLNLARNDIRDIRQTFQFRKIMLVSLLAVIIAVLSIA